jgi:hypothetical protein
VHIALPVQEYVREVFHQANVYNMHIYSLLYCCLMPCVTGPNGPIISLYCRVTAVGARHVVRHSRSRSRYSSSVDKIFVRSFFIEVNVQTGVIPFAKLCYSIKDSRVFGNRTVRLFARYPPNGLVIK